LYKVKLALILLFFTSALTGFAQTSSSLLDEQDVWLLVMNIPDAMDLECRKGCPNLEFHPEGKYRMYVLLRNQCAVSGNGTVGNYTVDLRDGRIWIDIDESRIIDSDRLQRLRAVLINRHQRLAGTGRRK
jgi:hypothetical protein